MQLEIAPMAERDLSRISRYIAKDRPLAAERWLDGVWQTIEAICRSPLAFPLAQQGAFGMRKTNFGRYLIFYRTQGESVRIERVLHGMRDLGKILC